MPSPFGIAFDPMLHPVAQCAAAFLCGKRWHFVASSRCWTELEKFWLSAGDAHTFELKSRFKVFGLERYQVLSAFETDLRTGSSPRA
jgi:hypothetical protein